MPQVIHSYKGDNQNPRLKMGKAERELLLNAMGCCNRLESLTKGYCSELSDEAGECAKRLARLAEIEELDLTKPW